MPQKTRTTEKSCRNLATSALRMILLEISENGKFSNFLSLNKTKTPGQTS
jgi:hypothetical protein